MARNLDAKVVKAAAEKHGWLDIISHFARQTFGRAIDYAANGQHTKHAPCPFHKDSKDGFRFFRDADKTGGAICNSCGPWSDGFKLLMRATNADFPDVVDMVGGYLGIEGASPAPKASDKPVEQIVKATVVPQRSEEEILTTLRRVWGESLPITDPKAEPFWRFLFRRGLSVQPLQNEKAFRFHPALSYFDDNRNFIGRFPALLSGVSNADGAPLTVHRLYLSEDGRKAEDSDPRIGAGQSRKMMAIPYSRFPEWDVDQSLAIRIGAPGKILGVAEGLETALAAYMATGIPTWSTIAASFLEKFTPPEGVEQVLIWADLDRSYTGAKAAVELKQRLWSIGVRAQILLPEADIPDGKKGVDWNDIWLERGSSGFPRPDILSQAA